MSDHAVASHHQHSLAPGYLFTTGQQALADSGALEVVSLQDLGVASADACILKRFQLASGAVRTTQHHLTQGGDTTVTADFQIWVMCQSFVQARALHQLLPSS